jgi:hypothetical protein
MPQVLTAGATVLCVHGGPVTLPPGRPTVTAGGANVLAYGDLEGMPVACPLKPPLVPCVAVVSTLAGFSTVLTVGGAPVLLTTATGATNAGTWSVAAPGQVTVEASR